MKKVLKTISLFLVVVLLSGCVKYNIEMNITKDKKMNMVFVSAVDKTMFGEEAQETEDSEELQKLKDAGWKLEKYEDDKWKGSKLSKSFDDIDKLSTENETIFDLNKFGQEGQMPANVFQKTTQDGKTVYKAKFAFKMTSGNEEIQDETNEEMDLGENDSLEEVPEDDISENNESMEEMIKKMSGSMDLKLTVNVPKVISNNATTVDGNKLTWDLTKMQEGTNIEFAFSLDGGSSFPLIYVIIGGCVLLIIIVLVVLLSKKKTSNDMTTTNTQVPSEPVAPVEQAPVQNIQPEPVQNNVENNTNQTNNL